MNVTKNVGARVKHNYEKKEKTGPRLLAPFFIRTQLLSKRRIHDKEEGRMENVEFCGRIHIKEEIS